MRSRCHSRAWLTQRFGAVRLFTMNQTVFTTIILRMQRLRSLSLLARLILAWFVLTVGVAIASPIVHPQTMELVCTTGGAAKLVVLDDDGEQATTAVHHTLDCPLCLQLSAPAALDQAAVHHPEPLAHALQTAVAATIAAMVGAPLPPRGPPAFTS